MPAVDFRVLGRVGVTVDGEPRRLRPMETTVLAVLLADANRVSFSRRAARDCPSWAAAENPSRANAFL